MNIAFSNLKGGCGSTTLVLLMAHYLASLNKTVYLIDLTYERSLEMLHQRSLLLEENLPFEFFASDLSKAPLLINKLSREDVVLLFDLPKLSEDQLYIRIFKEINTFIIPFTYGTLGISAAIRYALIAAKVAKNSNSIFLPNGQGEHVNGEHSISAQRLLRELGKLSAPLSFHLGLQSLESLSISAQILFDFWAPLGLLSDQYLQVS
ncbi:hypothetical protein [Pedobacter sp. Leaf250]|uniref:hypothetical protein n=1 Tax=Pedobacter sp. Leaf250 TaxID=2876559 RepID=UPI001E53676C|nr:hypothetical protein [Pedobacter sp. Leaf250]